MPSIMDLINIEKLASAISIISSFQGLFSSIDAEKAEIANQKSPVDSTEYTIVTMEANKFALDSTIYSAIGTAMFLITAMLRKEQLEEKIRKGTSKVSIQPSIVIVLGFFIVLIGTVMRIPAIQQRLQESIVPVIL